jgi:hypothetical protein
MTNWLMAVNAEMNLRFFLKIRVNNLRVFENRVLRRDEVTGDW